MNSTNQIMALMPDRTGREVYRAVELDHCPTPESVIVTVLTGDKAGQTMLLPRTALRDDFTAIGLPGVEGPVQWGDRA